MSIKERFKKYLTKRGISQGKFEKLAGLSNAYIDKDRNSILSPQLKKIREAAPDLNIDWLLSGEGEMLIGQKSQQNTRTTTDDRDDLVFYLKKAVDDKDKEISRMDMVINEIKESKELWKEKALGYEKKISADVGDMGSKRQALPGMGQGE